MTDEYRAFCINDIESRLHRLVVRDALWVGACNCIDKSFGEFDFSFRRYLIVADNINSSGGGHYGYAVEGGAVEFYVLYLDDSLAVKASTGKIIADGDTIGHVLDTEDMHHLDRSHGLHPQTC